MNANAPAPLSVQLWSLRHDWDRNAAQALERLAALGFRFVEPYGVGQPSATPAQRLKSARGLRALLDAMGLGVSGVHATAPLAGGAPDIFREMKALRTDLCVVPSLNLVRNASFESLHTRQATLALADTLNTAAALCTRAGVTLAYHNHAAEWQTHEDGQPAYTVLIDHLDEVVGVELDIYWAQVAGHSPARVLDRLGSWVVALHLKDGPLTVSAAQPQTPLGGGLVDYCTAVRAASSAH